MPPAGPCRCGAHRSRDTEPFPTGLVVRKARPPDRTASSALVIGTNAWFDTFFPLFGEVASLDGDHDGILRESAPCLRSGADIAHSNFKFNPRR